MICFTIEKMSFVFRIRTNKNGDINIQSMLSEWQGNYDIDWPRHSNPCPSLSELQLHKTKSKNKGVCMLVNNEI